MTSTFYLALGLAAAQPSTGSPRDRIAVLPLELAGFGEEATAELGGVFADAAATQLSRLGRSVVSVADVRARVRYDQLREVLEGCEGEACGGQTAELGAMLDAEYLLRGSVLRRSRGYMVSLAMLRAADGSAVGRFDGEAGSDVMIPATLRRGVRVILGREYDPGAVGVLAVTTVPPGARVEVDGEVVGRAPVTLRRFPAGDHEVVMTSSTARVVRPVLVEPGALARLDIDLERPPVTVHVFSTPEGARVTRGEAVLGTTPILLEDVPAEPIELEFTAPGYRTRTVSIDLRARERAQPGRPIAVEGALTEAWPVALGAILGVVSDSAAAADGVGFSGELTVDLGDRVQLGVGGTHPAAVFGTVRVFALRDGLELGALARVAGALSTAPAIPEDAREVRVAVQGGLVLGWSWATAAGRFGLLAEGGPAFDLDGNLSVPVTVAGQWRFR